VDINGNQLIAAARTVTTTASRIAGCPPPDVDGDKVTAQADCNDQDPNVHPGAIEKVNNDVDENCDGLKEFDRDGDGFRVPGTDC
jgi:hypothetical protein